MGGAKHRKAGPGAETENERRTRALEAGTRGRPWDVKGPLGDHAWSCLVLGPNTSSRFGPGPSIAGRGPWRRALEASPGIQQSYVIGKQDADTGLVAAPEGLISARADLLLAALGRGRCVAHVFGVRPFVFVQLRNAERGGKVAVGGGGAWRTSD